MSLAQRRGMVDREHPSLSTARQCALLGVARSSLYYRPRESSGENLALMQAMDRQYLETPFYGSRRMKVWLAREGRRVSRKRGAATDAHPGAASHLPESPHQPAGAGAPGLSLSVGKDQRYPAQPGVGRRHNLLDHGPGIPLPGGHHGLAQPVRDGLAIIQHIGGRLLRGRLEGGAEARPAEGLQHRQGSQFTSLEFTHVL